MEARGNTRWKFLGRSSRSCHQRNLRGPYGGRPPIGHWIVLKVIWFVLVTGCRWGGRSAGNGLFRGERRIGVTEPGKRAESGIDCTCICSPCCARLEVSWICIPRSSTAFRCCAPFGGGEATGPGPVDRGKPGSKHTFRWSIATARRWRSAWLERMPVTTRRSSRCCWSFPMLLGSVAGLKNIPTRCTRIVATTATTLGPCCVGWESSQ